MAFRSRSPERVVDDLVMLASRYGRLAFIMADTIMDATYTHDVLPRLRDTDLDFSIFYETKSDLTKEEIRLLRDAGVDRIQPGTESLSTPILKLVRKGVTGLQNVRLVKWCAEFGVDVSWNLLYGIPGEPPAEYDAMADNMQSLTHLQPPRLFPIWLDRFTPFYERSREFGFEIIGPPPHARVVYPVDEAALADLVHSFEYRRTDGCDPETYVGGVRRVIEDWTKSHAAGGYRSLRYGRGPGFLRIIDRRPNVPARDYTLGGPEAAIYMACDDGATPAEVRNALQPATAIAYGVEAIRAFLDELVALRLVYRERDSYLALALSAKLAELGAH
jgi:ribosomal peptide maturation radical SAM protein 1